METKERNFRFCYIFLQFQQLAHELRLLIRANTHYSAKKKKKPKQIKSRVVIKKQFINHSAVMLERTGTFSDKSKADYVSESD